MRFRRDILMSKKKRETRQNFQGLKTLRRGSRQNMGSKPTRWQKWLSLLVRHNIFTVIAVVLAFVIGISIGFYQKKFEKCPDGQVMVNVDGEGRRCFTPGVYYYERK